VAEVLDLLREHGLDISRRLLIKTLDAEGFHKRLARSKPPLDAVQRLKRYEYCAEHLGTNWKWVVFTDEAQLCIGANYKVWVWRTAEEEYDDTCLVPKLRHYDGFQVWAAVWYGGRSPLVRLDLSESEGKKGGFTAKLYKAQILEDALIPCWDAVKNFPDPYIIEDGSKIHDAIICGEVKDSMGYRMALHPPNSPDLNMIENVWALLKRRIFRRVPRPRNLDQLWDVAQEEWEGIEQEDIDRWIEETMPARIKKVYHKRGAHIKG